MGNDKEEPWVNIRIKKHTQRKMKILSALKDLPYSDLLDLALENIEKEDDSEEN